MGNQQQKYSVPIGEKQEGETSVYRHPDFVNGLISDMKGMKTIQELFLFNVNKYPNNNLLGTQVITGLNSKHYAYKTYSECLELAKQIGSGIINLKLIPEVIEYEGINLKMVGVFAKNREEWLLLEFANFLYGNTMIPLFDTLGPESIPFVLNQSQINTIFCSSQSISTLLKVEDLGKLQSIISFDALKDETIQQLKEKNIVVHLWQDVINAGKANIQPFAEVKPNDVFTFSYTSGTTGNPKGVMITHINFLVTSASSESRGIVINENDVHLSYLPLPHVFERVLALTMMGNGATICFYGGDVLKIKEDLCLARPTIFVSVPRLYQRLYSIIKDKLDSLQGYKKTMADYAFNTKLYYLRNGGHVQHKLWDKLIFNKTKEAFGGRVRFMITASAPISGEILDFLKIVACCPVMEAYGQTESTGGSFITNPNDSISDHVGGPLSHTEFKLVDVVDMKYTNLDKNEKGEDQPRGEICFRGLSNFKGYYRDSDKTKEAVDIHGWLHTGDIGTILPNGSVQIIDRMKNIFKLSQGEYIAPEKIENIYAKVKGVQECFVYGDSKQFYCVAIIVPAQEVITQLATTMNIQGTLQELCLNQEIVKHFLTEIQKKGKIDNLNGMENVKKLYLESRSFVEYGCMTTTMKLQRHNAKLQFKPILDKLYEE